METTDKQFFLTFTGVTAILIILAIIVLLAANLIGSRVANERKSQAQIKLSNDRIKPIGQVSLKSQPVKIVKKDPTTIVAVVETEQVDSLASADTGEKTYGGICQSCHAAGIGGAPIVGDISIWRKRLESGTDKLYQSVINGLGIMPAKGGDPSLTDAEIRAAVDYMIDVSQ